MYKLLKNYTSNIGFEPKDFYKNQIITPTDYNIYFRGISRINDFVAKIEEKDTIRSVNLEFVCKFPAFNKFRFENGDKQKKYFAQYQDVLSKRNNTYEPLGIYWNSANYIYRDIDTNYYYCIDNRSTVSHKAQIYISGNGYWNYV